MSLSPVRPTMMGDLHSEESTTEGACPKTALMSDETFSAIFLTPDKVSLPQMISMSLFLSLEEEIIKSITYLI